MVKVLGLLLCAALAAGCGDGGGAASGDADAATASEVDGADVGDVATTPDTAGATAGDGYCAGSNGVTPNDRPCPAPAVNEPAGYNPGPPSTFASCCDGDTCSDAACAEGELCDRVTTPPLTATPETTGVCRRPCRTVTAHWTCFSAPGCVGGELETTHDCAANETCRVYGYRFALLEQPGYVTRGLCVAPDVVE